jgi:hypothetical protein
MDNNDEMMVQQLMQEEAEPVAESKKHHLLITALLHLRARLQPSQTRGSRKGKSKDRPTSDARAQMLEDDYFRDNRTHVPKTFQCCF